VVHFACHGIQDLKNPLDSGIILSDGRLKVSQIMRGPGNNLFAQDPVEKHSGSQAMRKNSRRMALQSHSILTFFWLWSHMVAHGQKAIKWLQWLLRKLSNAGSERIRNSMSLAFLSACETAKGDEGTPDEAMHLAAAVLFAGFRGVVATMWFVLYLFFNLARE
jgi:CHAT domain-containing protein